MVQVKKLGVVLEPTNLPFENLAVLNPGCWQDGNSIHMFYRAIDQDHKSSIGYACLEGPTTVKERWNKPILSREYEYESHGLEDPRIVRIDTTFYVFYVAHDGKNAVTAYATSANLKALKKMGIISPQLTYHEVESIFANSQLKDAYYLFASFYEEHAGKDVLIWEKDMFLFPEKINGKFVMVHRILPDIQLVFFKDPTELTREFWRDYFTNLSQYVLLESKHWFELRGIGGGCPPIKTKDGWLFIFHAIEEGNKGRVYHACAALLDLENPLKVKGRLHEPLFSPTEEWEQSGFVSNVVFPTGTAVFGDTLYIYYGAADKRIAVASLSIEELLKEMQDPTKQHKHAGGQQ